MPLKQDMEGHFANAFVNRSKSAQQKDKETCLVREATLLQTDTCAARSNSFSRLVVDSSGFLVAKLGFSGASREVPLLPFAAAPAAAATAGCNVLSNSSARGSMRTNGVSHLLLMSGGSNLPQRSLKTSSQYDGSARVLFHTLDTSNGTSQCTTQYLVAAALARHHSSYLHYEFVKFVLWQRRKEKEFEVRQRL